ncbi:unnamed protein product [Linum trigynum]|uniref:F-box domain-containing protein n=1 Tax=Linum trigynum TaxID=586398 RepID=A0AAV2DAB0_9ROSI
MVLALVVLPSLRSQLVVLPFFMWFDLIYFLRQVTMEHFSDLPDEIIHHILSFWKDNIDNVMCVSPRFYKILHHNSVITSTCLHRCSRLYVFTKPQCLREAVTPVSNAHTRFVAVEEN